jgi:hypothetical protein
MAATAHADIAGEIRRIAVAAGMRATSLVPQWLPGGKREHDEYIVRNPRWHDRTPGSFKINLKTGEWSDFATDDAGGDLVQLRAFLNGNLGQSGAQIAAAREIAGLLGMECSLGTPERKRKQSPAAEPDWQLVNTYDYTTAEGDLLFQVCRYETETQDGRRKKFAQRRPDGAGGWLYSVKGIAQVPYCLPELEEALATGRSVFIAEGEKATDALRKIGAPATCNAMGAKKWPDELCHYFQGADVVLIPDNDEAGREHMQLVGEKLKPVAGRLRILELPGLVAKEDAYEWVERGGDLEALYSLVESHGEDWGQRTPASNFGAIPWWDMDKPGAEHDWLIKGLLTRGERSMMAGPSQSGKSFLALDMALSVARGEPYWGRRCVRGGVLYQAGEGGRGLKKRMRAYRQHHGLAPDQRLPFVLLPAVLDLHGGDDPTSRFIEEALRWNAYMRGQFGLPLELIIIDTLSTATPGANENDSGDMSRVLARCARISEATKAHVQLVHHMNAAGEKPRGHTSIFANLENVITVSRDRHAKDRDGRDIRTARISKQKDGEDGATWRFVLVGGIKVGRDRDGDPITSCVVDAPNGNLQAIGGNQSANAARQTDAERLAFQALEQAVIEHGEPAPASLGLPHGIRVVEFGRWLTTYARRSFHDDEAVAKKALAQAGARLLARGKIGRDTPFVWIPRRTTDAEQPQSMNQESMAHVG